MGQKKIEQAEAGLGCRATRGAVTPHQGSMTSGWPSASSQVRTGGLRFLICALVRQSLDADHPGRRQNLGPGSFLQGRQSPKDYQLLGEQGLVPEGVLCR